LRGEGGRGQGGKGTTKTKKRGNNDWDGEGICDEKAMKETV
jgi:hypothetical protein